MGPGYNEDSIPFAQETTGYNEENGVQTREENEGDASALRASRLN